MVEQQIRTFDVFDPDVLRACSGIPRNHFVPLGCEQVAYADSEIPLPHNQLMLRPSIVGRLLQSLDLKPSDEVLEIGTGSGYVTACIAEVAASVVTVDIFEDLCATASARLKDADVDNASVRCMDAMKSLPEGRFDAIAVTGSLPCVHQPFLDALNPGGRLFLVVGDSPAMTASLYTRDPGDGMHSDSLFETCIPPLILPEAQPEFRF